MARAAQPRRPSWQHRHPRRGDRRNPRAKTLIFDAARLGQLTAPGSTSTCGSAAENGHQAHHSYSVASAPEDEAPRANRRAPSRRGEVSPHLVDELEAGDQLGAARADRRLLRMGAGAGRPGAAGPGGSGVVPLCARCCATTSPPTAPPRCGSCTPRGRLATSSTARSSSPGRCRSRSRRPAHLHPTLARELERAPWTDRPRAARAHSPWTPAQRPLIYVCGPSGFVEAVANGLVDNGHLPEQPLESMARRVGHGGVTCPNWRVASSRPS